MRVTQGRVAGAAWGFRMWGYPWARAAFIAASLVIVVNQVASDPRNSALGLLLMGAGIPVYYFRDRRA